MKARFVQADERISSDGGRALLNLEFCSCHEAVAGYGDYLHGEAVSIGLLCAFVYLNLKVCTRFGGNNKSFLWFNSALNIPCPSTLMEKMLSDKKVSHGKLNCDDERNRKRFCGRNG